MGKQFIAGIFTILGVTTSASAFGQSVNYGAVQNYLNAQEVYRMEVARFTPEEKRIERVVAAVYRDHLAKTGNVVPVNERYAALIMDRFDIDDDYAGFVLSRMERHARSSSAQRSLDYMSKNPCWWMTPNMRRNSGC
jgi:hypothetical protein